MNRYRHFLRIEFNRMNLVVFCELKTRGHNVDRGDPLTGAFRSLNFADDITYFHYLYLWREGLIRLAQTRCTIDI